MGCFTLSTTINTILNTFLDRKTLHVTRSYTRFVYQSVVQATKCVYNRVYQSIMKVRRNITLSEEANAILNRQENASQHVENLLLGKDKPTPWLNLEYRIDELKELIQKLSTGATQEKTCCHEDTRFKHWEWTPDGRNYY